jgi:cytochrome P450
MMILGIHKKHGPVVRIGPNMLSFDTSSSVRAIYGPRHANLTKSDFHLTLDATISSPSIFALTDKDRHAFRRRVISYAFTEKAMKSSGEFVLHHTQVLRDVLKKKVGKGWTKVDVGDYMMWWGTDIISSLAMGKSFNCLTSPQYREGLVIMRNAAKFTYWVGVPFVLIDGSANILVTGRTSSI